jgi:hypothetical protein
MYLEIAAMFGLPLLSGFTYLAYRHPDGFDLLYNALQVAITLAFLMALTWDFAISKTQIELSAFVLYDKSEEARDLVDKLKISSGLVFAIYILLCGYLLFLRLLPTLVGSSEKARRSGGPTDGS